VPFPELLHFRDTTPDSTSKNIFTVPTGEVYELLWVFVIYEASAAVADRQPIIMVSDPDTYPTLIRGMGGVITTSEKWYVTFAPGGSAEQNEGTAEREAFVPIPSGLMLPPGFILSALVALFSGAGDDMTVHAMVRRHQPGVL
jgi:hypothetical protein